MPEIKAVARKVFLDKPDLEVKADEQGVRPPVGFILEILVTAAFEDKPPTSAGHTCRFPCVGKERSQTFQWFLDWCQQHSLDYTEAKPILAEALDNPREDEEKPAAVLKPGENVVVDGARVTNSPESTGDLTVSVHEEDPVEVTEYEDKSGVRADVIGDEVVAMQWTPTTADDLVPAKAGLRRRALAKLTLEEQKALGLADPRRLSREEFRHAMSDLIPSSTGGPDYDPAKRLLGHFDYMEEVAEEMRRSANA